MRYSRPAHLLLALGLFLLPARLCGQETVHPTGYSIVSTYTLTELEVAAGDTLAITRTVVNNESFPLSGLYFSENLPAQFEIVSYSVTVAGAAGACLFEHAALNPVVAGYETYYWIIDEPGESDTLGSVLNPGDSTVLELRLTCDLAGEFQFPLHTTVFYGNANGFFSADGAAVIVVSESAVDTIPPAKVIDLGMIWPD
ncbi:MAG TPA: hypothetical protein VMY05_04800 [Acidobacteriota bacterium]|nr:hypothetical protein [Acidobacteriota bacterium]